MTEISAAAIRSHDCKTPGCAGEASSAVGRYAYCPECRERRAGDRPASAVQATGGSFAERIKLAAKLAVQVDKAKAKAEKTRRQADEAARVVASLEADLRALVAELT